MKTAAFLLGWSALLTMATRSTSADESTGALLARAKAVLAQLEGDIRLPGLSAPVEVLRSE